MAEDTKVTLDRIEQLLQKLADVTAEADRIRAELAATFKQTKEHLAQLDTSRKRPSN
jgi:hypothetical protein